MPTDRWIAEHYPPDFMADMLADVVGDFTDVQLHPAIDAARDDENQIAVLAAVLGATLSRLIQAGTVIVTVCRRVRRHRPGQRAARMPAR